MARYILHLGVALVAMAALVGGFAALSCYRAPTPICGFHCGPQGECPAEYTCSSFENRCHLNGSDPAFRCGDTSDDEPEDAPIDLPIADASSDAVNDAGNDAGNDAANDAPTD